jgi:hypothetical protein
MNQKSEGRDFKEKGPEVCSILQDRYLCKTTRMSYIGR